MFKRRTASPTQTVEYSSSPRCVMCGASVVVDASGFCPLGHFVGIPQASAAVGPEPVRPGEPEPGAIFTEPTVPVGDEPTQDLAPAQTVFTEAAPESDAPVADVEPVADLDFRRSSEPHDTLPTDDPLAALLAAPAFAADEVVPDYAVSDEVVPDYAGADEVVPEVPAYVEADEVVSDYAANEVVAEMPAYAEADDDDSDAQHALTELLAFSSLDQVSDVEPVAFSALDTDDLPGEILEEDFADFADFAETHEIAAPDDDESDAAAARKRAAGLLGGGLLTLAALALSLAALPTL